MILGCSWELEGMPLAKLLASQRGWGSERCRGLLIALQLREDKPVGSMTERQRRAVAAALEAASGRSPGARRPAANAGERP